MSAKAWYCLARVLDWIAWPFQWPYRAQQWAWEKWNCSANQYWIDHPEEYQRLMDALKKEFPAE